ncbi:MAG: hypothetical protein AB7N91_06855 [Candidatus Tectimicrobiota bacterium]
MQTLFDRPEVRDALRALEPEACQDFTRLLSPREAVVLQGRFLGHPPRRWESLARAMGTRRDLVRQMEIEIIKKFDAWQESRQNEQTIP